MISLEKINNVSHKRYNPLTGDWVLVSPHRAKRPWQGKKENKGEVSQQPYDSKCYLCSGNSRAGGTLNPQYTDVFVFDNDYPAIIKGEAQEDLNDDDLLVARAEHGICRVICFSPRHDLTLAQLPIASIKKVVDTWTTEYLELGAYENIKYVQIFENKGEIMGCSNPHPHGQIWATESVPDEPLKESARQRAHYQKYNRTLLGDYLALELKKKDRIVIETDHFVVLVPFWAVWPFETMIVSKRAVPHLGTLTNVEKQDFACCIHWLTRTYDRIFDVSFPYSSGIHQAPTDGSEYPEWHLHMHFYPPLLRSATVKKFMVGFEMLGNPQRDITPEESACRLRELYKTMSLEYI